MLQGENIEVRLKNGEVKHLENVLVVPKNKVDMPTNSQTNDIVAYTLHIPKSCEFLSSFRGARITLRGKAYRVLGNPKPYTPANTPTDWCMPVDVALLGYSETITIQTCEVAQNDKGDSVSEWRDVLTAGTSALLLEEKEDLEASRTRVIRSVMYTLDWDDRLKGLNANTSRIVWDGVAYDITSINNVGYVCDIVKIKARVIL